MSTQPGQLEGKTAVITGAARGIGAGIARGFAAQGCAVTVVDRRPEVEGVAAEIDGAFAVGEVSDASFVERTIADAGGCDVLINNAGEVWPSGPLDEWAKALADYDQLVNSNLRGTFLFGRAVAPGLIERGAGNIINISSDHVKPAPESGWHHGHGAMDLYNATKWALNGLTFDWAKALRPHGVRVNNVCMGATDTEMLRGWIGADPDPDYLATWMTPEGIAAIVLELIGEGPSGRTGDNIALWAGHPTVLPPPQEGRAASI